MWVFMWFQEQKRARRESEVPKNPTTTTITNTTPPTCTHIHRRCSFCATGQQGFTRQLTDSEIFEQALLFSRELVRNKGERLSNVVFMGT